MPTMSLAFLVLADMLLTQVKQIFVTATCQSDFVTDEVSMCHHCINYLLTEHFKSIFYLSILCQKIRLLVADISSTIPPFLFSFTQGISLWFLQLCATCDSTSYKVSGQSLRLRSSSAFLHIRNQVFHVVLSSAVVCAESHDRFMFLRSSPKVHSLVCLVFFRRWTEPSSLHVWPICALSMWPVEPTSQLVQNYNGVFSVSCWTTLV